MTPEHVTGTARVGAAWSVLVFGVALPLPYLRDIMLGRVDGTGEILGRFVLLQLLIQAVHTFFFPGGRNVFPAFLPKLGGAKERARFFTAYLYLVLAASAVAVAVTTQWPGLLDTLLGEALERPTRRLLQFLVPFLLLSTLAISVVMARMSFLWASLLGRTQLVCVTAMLGMIVLSGSDALEVRPLVWFVGTILFATLVNILVSWWIALRHVGLAWRPKLPPGCLRFSVLAYFDGVMVFAYLAVDRYFIAMHLGIAAVGIYTAMLQIARIVPLGVQQLGHVLLTTFSTLLGTDAEEALTSAYQRVSRLTTGVFAMIAVTMVFQSRLLASMFGPVFAEEHGFLILLAVAMNVDSLRTINTMTLMAYERMDVVLWAKLGQNGVQFILTVTLISSMGIHGVILAKAAGHVVSVVMLFVATGRVGTVRRLLPPISYYVGQAVVVASGCVAYVLDGRSLGWSVVGTLVGWAVIWWAGGFSLADIRAMIPRRSHRSGESD